MYTEKEIADIKRTISVLKKCKKECGQCKHSAVLARDIGKRGIVYWFECHRNAVTRNFTYFERLSTLRDDLIDQLEFEIS